MNVTDKLAIEVQNTSQERAIARSLVPEARRDLSKLQRRRRLQRNNAIELQFQTLYRWIAENHPTRDALNLLNSAHAELRHTLKSIG